MSDFGSVAAVTGKDNEVFGAGLNIDARNESFFTAGAAAGAGSRGGFAGSDFCSIGFAGAVAVTLGTGVNTGVVAIADGFSVGVTAILIGDDGAAGFGVVLNSGHIEVFCAGADATDETGVVAAVFIPTATGTGTDATFCCGAYIGAGPDRVVVCIFIGGMGGIAIDLPYAGIPGTCCATGPTDIPLQWAISA